MKRLRNLVGYLLGLAHDRYCGCSWPDPPSSFEELKRLHLDQSVITNGD